jgi:predicted aminopeptidase
MAMLFRAKHLCALAAVVLIAGCANFTYYLQSVRGQLDIWSRQQDIETVLERDDTPQALRDKLARVLEIREFASSELALPENRSYRLYANLERPYAVWNVFAAPEFSVHPREWCFAFAGCVKYRGYFAKPDADAFAAEVAGDGSDVFVGGVPAYSLLGYFPDPVLNTFINYPPPFLARLIFHELAHQVVYVRDDSVFNESFAVTVEQEGLKRWLERYGSPADRKLIDVISGRRDGFVRLIRSYRDRANALYASGLPPPVMRVRKAELFTELEADFRKLRETWGNFPGYDHWFSQKPNNALLASVSIYTRRVPAFQALLASQGGDLQRFYEEVKRLSRLEKAERTAALQQLMPRTADAGQIGD